MPGKYRITIQQEFELFNDNLSVPEHLKSQRSRTKNKMVKSGIFDYKKIV